MLHNVLVTFQEILSEFINLDQYVKNPFVSYLVFRGIYPQHNASSMLRSAGRRCANLPTQQSSILTCNNSLLFLCRALLQHRLLKLFPVSSHERLAHEIISRLSPPFPVLGNVASRYDGPCSDQLTCTCFDLYISTVLCNVYKLLGILSYLYWKTKIIAMMLKLLF